MKVRVYDKDNDIYFISEVYGIINSGYYEKYLVLQEKNGAKKFRLIDYLDKRVKEGLLPVNINVINNNSVSRDWIVKNEEELVGTHKSISNKESDIYFYRGYSFVYQNKEMLIKLMNGQEIPVDKFNGFSEVCTDLDNWNYIYTQNDIEYMMKEFSGFHDSVLVSAKYVSGAGKIDGGMSVTDHIRQVEMVFDSDWNRSINIVFEGVLSFNLYPARDNFCSDLFEATILRNKETIYFYTGEVNNIDDQYMGTWINSLGMRWKFL